MAGKREAEFKSDTGNTSATHLVGALRMIRNQATRSTRCNDHTVLTASSPTCKLSNTEMTVEGSVLGTEWYMYKFKMGNSVLWPGMGRGINDGNNKSVPSNAETRNKSNPAPKHQI